MTEKEELTIMDHIPWRGVAQWISIGLVVTGMMVIQDRRLTVVEVKQENELMGYNVLLKTMNERLNKTDAVIDARLFRIENKMDKIVERLWDDAKDNK
jgi:hypothetical protein